MGSAFPPDPRAAAAGHVGVIPRAMAALYARLADPPAGVEYAVRVGFVEIHREEVRALLTPAGGGPRGLPGGVHVRELPGGGIVLAGAVEREAKTQAEMVAVLEEGSALRATAATGMNKTSSRSHAVFTVTLEQRRAAPAEGAAPPVARPKAPGGASSDSEGDEAAEINDEADAYLCAKVRWISIGEFSWVALFPGHSNAQDPSFLLH
jgi:kinesin family protein 4/21/27